VRRAREHWAPQRSPDGGALTVRWTRAPAGARGGAAMAADLALSLSLSVARSVEKTEACGGRRNELGFPGEARRGGFVPPRRAESRSSANDGRD
jgi:hypothetical protein